MKLRNVQLAFIAVGLGSAGSAKSQDFFFTGQPTAATQFQTQVMAKNVINATYFAAIGNNVGYGGMQQWNDQTNGSHVFLFSAWDQSTTDLTYLIGYNSSLNVIDHGRFGGEGTGDHLNFYYPWQLNVAYRFAYRVSLEPDNQHERWSGYFYDPAIGAWTYAGTFRLLGNGNRITYNYWFNENFGGTWGLRKADYSNAWWLGTNNTWTELLNGYTVNSPHGPNDYGRVDPISGALEVTSSPTTTDQPELSLSYSAGAGDAILYIPYRISCGSDVATAGSTQTKCFESDTHWTGSTYTATDSTTVTTAGVANAAPQNVYHNIRGGTDFSYVLEGLKKTKSYTVRLHFVENWNNSAGQRKENVSINGSTVLSNFDIYAAAGAKYKAVVKSFSATPDANGKITIRFQTASGSIDPQSIVSGIEAQ